VGETKEIKTLSQYPSQTFEKLRYADTDRQGHINNSIFAVLCESGRVNFLYDAEKPLSVKGTEFVIAEITIRFIKELNWSSRVDIGTGVSRIGRSSFGLTQALFVNGDCVATADSVIVLMDEETRRSTQLPNKTRAALEELKVVS
jgi:acyl-CoA thioester hydrolase